MLGILYVCRCEFKLEAYLVELKEKYKLWICHKLRKLDLFGLADVFDANTFQLPRKCLYLFCSYVYIYFE